MIILLLDRRALSFMAADTGPIRVELIRPPPSPPSSSSSSPSSSSSIRWPFYRVLPSFTEFYRVFSAAPHTTVVLLFLSSLTRVGFFFCSFFLSFLFLFFVFFFVVVFPFRSNRPMEATDPLRRFPFRPARRRVRPGSSLTEFYRVFFFLVFSRVSPSFTGFLPSFTEQYRFFYWFILGFGRFW